MKRCQRCAAEYVSAKKQPGPKDTCESCLAYLHSCLNCRFYDERANNKCYIPTTEWIADKEGPNFCDEFEFADAEAQAQSAGAHDSARNALDALFGNALQDTEKKSNLSDFEKLFGE